MKPLLQVLAGALLIGASLPTLGQTALGVHPEEAIPDNLPRMVSPGPYDELVMQMQQKLKERGFDAGPVNGDFGPKTQAALAQFQLATMLPASGMPDPRTLLELGVEHAQTFAEATAPGGDSAAAGATGPATTSR
jgi:peptidoglycan hydrolase-like protein with peptidoglycan-binding domain